MNRPLPTLIATCLVASASPAALAHDFWVQPSSFTPAVNEPLKVQLRVGDAFPGDLVPRNDQRIVRFAIVDSEGEKPIAGRDGSETAGVARPAKNGLHIIAYRSTTASVTLEAAKFEQYLRDKGLEQIIAQRAEQHSSDKPGREIYSRCAKALLTVGAASSSDNDRAIGLRLELIAETNPCTLGESHELGVRLEFEGKPCAGRLVVARSPDHADLRVSGRTDEHGRVTLKLPEPGMWMLTAVHMIAAPAEPPGADLDADWESLWASLTFEIPAARPK